MGFRSVVGSVLIAAFVTLAAAARAQEPEPLVTDRPDFTESAETIAPGRAQLETGYTFTRAEEEEIQSFGEVLVRVGVGRRWEVRLGVGSYVDVERPGGGTDGFEDSSLGVKLLLAEGGGGAAPQAAVIVASSVPTGDDELGSSAWQPEAVLSLAWDLAPRWSLGTNLGYAYAKDGRDRFDQLFASVAVGFAIDERWGAFGEAFAFSREEPGGSESPFVDGGVTYLVSEDFQLDLRVGVGLDGSEPNYFAGFGAAVRW